MNRSRGGSATRDTVGRHRRAVLGADHSEIDDAQRGPGHVRQPGLPGAGSRAGGSFSVGSSKVDVAATQGAPSGYYPSYWQYGLATVFFDGDRVSGWSNAGGVLKVK